MNGFRTRRLTPPTPLRGSNGVAFGPDGRLYVAQFLAGEISRDDAMKQIEDGWEEITNAEGRDKQLAAYKASLGVQR